MKNQIRCLVSKFMPMLGLLLALSPSVNASEYGCKVLLCLANPNGPTALAECVPPITQLWKDLANFDPFPTCALSGSSNTQAKQQPLSYYDLCPTGMKALDNGRFVMQGTQLPSKSYWRGPQPILHAGIGSGDGLTNWQNGEYKPLPDKVCVSNKVGETSVPQGSGDGMMMVRTDVYEQVTFLNPQSSPRIIDVIIDGSLARRVRW